MTEKPQQHKMVVRFENEGEHAEVMRVLKLAKHTYRLGSEAEALLCIIRYFIQDWI